MTCQACLHENDPFARYCSDCGRRLSHETIAAAPLEIGVWSDRARKCPKCTETIPARSRFCIACGAAAEAKTSSTRRIGWLVGVMVVGVVALALVAVTFFESSMH